MGGNGARLAYLAKKLAEYSGPRFKQVGSIDGVKVVEVLNQKSTKIPVESFGSDTYYVANPSTGKIEHIAFYDQNGNIKHSIDLDYRPDGTNIPYREYMRKGKLRSEGSHFHKEWPIDENGDKGRESHDRANISPVNRYYMRFVNKALRYNINIKDNEKK